MRHAIARDLPTPSIAQTCCKPLYDQCINNPPTGRVEFKSLPNERSQNRVWLFGLPGSFVYVPRRRRHGVKALLQTSIKSLLDFFAQVADIVGRYDCLN